ncbi:MAG: helix-turn-helix domain-containing protein [Spirochaetaceae bacterium]|nr:helix-turn-helix domain-containing protein [Spirochaetaceae bacterium]
MLFKRTTGTMVNNYIREQRLYLARREMEAGEGAEQAAFSAGFNNYTSFFRAHKARFDESPATFLQKQEDRRRSSIIN